MRSKDKSERVGARRMKVNPRAEKEKRTAEVGGMGDLRIHRKKEQGREAGRYYEQCANRVRGFFPRSVALSVVSVSVLWSLFSLPLILVYYSMGPGGAR